MQDSMTMAKIKTRIKNVYPTIAKPIAFSFLLTALFNGFKGKLSAMHDLKDLKANN